MESTAGDRDRTLKVLRVLIVLLFLGSILLFLGWKYEFFLPCAFHEITGWYCPGCGISRMFLSIFQMDIAAAWKYNPAVLVALPMLIFYIGYMIIRYLRGNGKPTGRIHNTILYTLIVYFLFFGVMRNLPAFQWMAP